MTKSFGEMSDRAMERDTERHLAKKGYCTECNGLEFIYDEQDDGAKTEYRKIACPKCCGNKNGEED